MGVVTELEYYIKGSSAIISLYIIK